ncbi:alpha/beta fold hydrolase [Mycobacterium sp.]|uniref:alpha/beta fold hydrolase n=1 Tax=Mycobacterium sp. TaxID=1785 RepID=UPI003D12EDB1
MTGRVVTRAKSRTAPVATIGGIRTRVLESDGGGSTVLLVHGYSDSADGWRAVMDRVAREGHRAVAVDLPYHGRAERPAGASFFGVVDDFVAAAVQNYGDGADVVVVGNSVGGTSALRVAQRAGLPLAAVLAIGPAGLVTPIWMRLAHRSTPAARCLLGLGGPTVLRGTNTAPALISAGFARAVARGHMSSEARAQYASHWGPGDLRRQLLLGGPTIAELIDPNVLEARPFHVPVTVAWGARDWISPARGATMLRRSHPEVTTRVLPGTGHCPQYDRPDLVAGLIGDVHRASAQNTRSGHVIQEEDL